MYIFCNIFDIIDYGRKTQNEIPSVQFKDIHGYSATAFTTGDKSWLLTVQLSCKEIQLWSEIQFPNK